MKKAVETKRAPSAIGPYSQAVTVSASEMLFCSGQIPLDPDGILVTGSIREQTRRVMENLKAIIEASGFILSDIAKTTIYLTDLKDFSEVNAIYESYFSPPFPARVTVQVAALPRGAAVEIDAIATR